ncbi:hypothetical protein O0L34_g11671 [Tuta absoluta]|nr:hypothetical protein O0L34_g11671 [Tuta absoluta]
MESPSMDTVYQAISALYENPNANEKEKASLWLGDVQKSIHSWKIADELLQQKKDVHSCYFAAQTMRSKVQHNIDELPGDALLSLRNSLVAHLENITQETSSAIVTQLCLALADLALQLPSWQNCISDLIKSFSNKNHLVLLEILTVLPQEIDSPALRLGENRREDIKNELRSNAQMVDLFLKESLNNSQNTHIALKVIKCLTSWIQVKAINIQDVPQNAVIGLCLQILRDHNSINTLHDAATDCLCSLLHCIEENNNNEEVERLLFDSVSALEESYHMAVAHEEEEKASNYARIFTELAETFLEKIITCASGGSSHFAMRSLELALVCCGHHDYEVAEITFNLWYRLSEEVYQRDYQPLTDVFKPHIQRLIEALARHCQCEPDHTQLPEEGDEFYEFRQKVQELIKDVVFIVGSSSVFRQMFGALGAAQDMSWEHTEAALYVMQSVAKNILPDEYEYVPKVVEAILSMPENTHQAVRKTCILLLGELCEWIEKHPECVQPTVQLLMRALHDKQLAAAAATALQNICKTCKKQAGVHAAALLSASRLANDLNLPLSTSVALMRALASSLVGLPEEQLTVAMREAAAVQISALNELVKSNKEPIKGTSSDPVVFLDRLAALFRDVEFPTTTASTSHPCVPAIGDAWPALQALMEKHQTDSRIMERTCRVVRFALRCTGRHCAELLPPLAATMGALYTAHAHSCVLYLASILVDELSGAPGCSEHLIQLAQTLMPRAFLLLQQQNGLKDNPDTVDDLFRLCIRFLQRIPLEFLSSGAMPAVMQCSLLASSLDHRDANSSVMKFLYDLVKAANSTRQDKQQIKALATETLVSYGEAVTHALISASVLHLHSYMLGEVAEVLLQLIAWQRSNGVDWVQTAVQKLPRERKACATEHQCWQFHQHALSADKCKEMTRLLRDFARLYR